MILEKFPLENARMSRRYAVNEAATIAWVLEWKVTWTRIGTVYLDVSSNQEILALSATRKPSGGDPLAAGRAPD